MNVTRRSIVGAAAAATALALALTSAGPANAYYQSAWKTLNCTTTTQASVYSEANTTGWHRYSGTTYSGTIYVGGGAQRTYGYTQNGQWQHGFEGNQGWGTASCVRI